MILYIRTHTNQEITLGEVFVSTSERAGESPGWWSALRMGKRCLAGDRLRHARCVGLPRSETKYYRSATAARPVKKTVTWRKRVDDVGILRGGGLCTHALSLDSGRFSPNPVSQIWAIGAAPQSWGAFASQLHQACWTLLGACQGEPRNLGNLAHTSLGRSAVWASQEDTR